MQTRGEGTSADYRFLGEYPDDFWWRSYSLVMDMDRPAILVDSDDVRWRACVAGIFSSRRDVVGRRIQYRLLMDGKCAEPDPIQEVAFNVVAESLVSMAHEEGQLIAGDSLDACLPPEDIAEMLVTPGEQTAARAADAGRRAYERHSLLSPLPQDLPLTHWAGGLGNPDARGALLARTRCLLQGQRTGCALVLNRSAGEREVATARLPIHRGTLAVLMSGSTQWTQPPELYPERPPAPSY